MSESIFILIAADPSGNKENNPGGQLTASKGLYDYAISQGYQLEILDTLQSGFPIPSVWVRLKGGLMRVLHLCHLLQTRQITGVILFSAAGLSFYERSLMAGLCRFYRTKTLFFMRSGFFLDDVKESRLKKMFAERLLKFPNKIAIQGEKWRPFYRNLKVPDDKIVTIRNWLPSFLQCAEQSIQYIQGEVIRFCFVGRLVEEKGIKELFESVRVLLKRFKFEFSFVGGGTLEPLLHRLIETYALTQYVQVTGWVEPKHIRAHLAQAHVFVLPSKAEGFPNALLEAMALGLPAICTDVGAVSDSLFDGVNGYLLDVGDVKSIQQAMTCYLEAPSLIEQHSKESLKVVREQHNRMQNCKLLFEQLT